MIVHLPLVSSAGRMRGLFGAPRQRRPRRAKAGLEVLEARTVLSTYTMPLVNDTLLNKYSIYVGGFSSNNLTLQRSKEGALGFATTLSGTWTTYKVGTVKEDYHRIEFDSSQFIDGSRMYFFVVPKGGTAPSFPYGTQPPDPPGGSSLFTYVELTNPNNGARPTVDVSTVDGFSFPVTLKLNDKHGAVGQPPDSPHVNRQSVISEYSRFMNANAGAGGRDYTVLELPKGAKSDGQSEGLLNPYFYLKESGPVGSLPANLASPLNTVFDGALNTLFGSSGWSLKASDQNIYTATAGTYQYGKLTNPVSGTPLKLPGIQLQGGGNTFTVFNPVGVNQFLGTNGQPIMATSVSGQLNQITLTNAPASMALQPGMYVFGAFGFDQANDAASAYINSPPTMNTSGQTVVTLNRPLAGPVTNDQVVFSQVPYLAILQNTSGEMVFGNTGFFADTLQQGYPNNSPQATTLGNIENQIVSAFNRGVAVVPGPSGPLSPSSNGYATQYWGTQTNWYPVGQPENVFSWFLHTAVIKTDPIFLRPPNPAKDHNGNLMGMAYGFAFDENPGPVPPAPSGQPEVPSKFDPVPDGTTKITITLGPWVSRAHTGK